jgi:glycerate kinase
MRVLVTGSAGPPVPDGAWPGGGAGSPADDAHPAVRDVARWWAASRGTGDTGAGTDVSVVELASAGPEFLDAFAPVAPELLAAVVPGPGGSDVPVAVRRDRRTGTVYADASQVPALDGGPHRPEAWPPRSSDAVGHLLALAADAARTTEGQPGRVVLATGGARSHDAGAGLLRTLAENARNRSSQSTRGGDEPVDALIDAEGAARGSGGEEPAEALRAARAALGGVHLVAAVASGAPLLGLHGASAALAARGVDDAVAQELERELGAVAHDVAAAVELLDRDGRGAVAGRDLLLTSSARRLAGAWGTGSGGGTAFAVAALGGRLVPALQVVADEVGLDERLAGADLVVVVADELGAHELGEGVVQEVAGRAVGHALPVVVVARAVVAGRREQAAAGLSGAYAWGTGSPREVVERVARTWSRA